MTDPTPFPARASSVRWSTFFCVSTALVAGCVVAAPTAHVERAAPVESIAPEVAADPLSSVAFVSSALDDPPAPAKGKEPVSGNPPLFVGWPKGQKPEAVLVFTGQTFGLLQPCGCSRPQTGGLERRAVFIQSLKDKGWPVAGIDLGDLYPEKPAVREQGRLKYIATMNALREMGYIAVGVGQTDITAQLDMLLGAYIAQKEQRPFTLAGNAVGLDGAGKIVPRLQRFPVLPGDTRPLIGSTEVADVGTLPIGIAGIVGKSLAVDARTKKLDTSIDFSEIPDALKVVRDELKNHKKQPKLNVLIYQGSSADAVGVAKDFPQFNIILCQASDPLPPLLPQQPQGTKTLIIEVGHKGQHVGVLGVFKKPDGGLDLKYQLVQMSEEFITPGTEEQAYKSNKTLKILEDYAKSVKSEIALGKDYPRVPHAAQIHAQGLNPKVNLTYVGSDACKACHAKEHEQWAKTKHGHAMDALEKLAKRPSLRQYDGECVRCHTVGFDHQSGYENEKKTAHLKHVGCESCHGPGSGHAADPKNKQLTALLALWKQGVPGDAKMPDMAFMEKMAKLGPEERGMQAIPPANQLLLNRVGGACMKCHDQDNDPHFDIYKYWVQVNHSGLAPAGGWPVVPPKK
ncbi:hypothetical protein J8F10_11340 [Gemmata sp. G18]|uniref:Cytochrome c-552/4 domain-containing protein n=1 Tax=Gemmata palustris TaxID=2822762 RepID=A0ABS5BQB4_9BACT|nr:multiheme c-type cytochrome [Gemmata palustris]MBP3955879.1 hypothetical protein [Gemmata palustris]